MSEKWEKYYDSEDTKKYLVNISMYLNMPPKTKMFEIPIFFFSTSILSVFKQNMWSPISVLSLSFYNGKFYMADLLCHQSTPQSWYNASVDNSIVKPQIDKTGVESKLVYVCVRIFKVGQRRDLVKTLHNKEQQTLATFSLPCSPLSSIHWRSASTPPLSAMDLHISSCNHKKPISKRVEKERSIKIFYNMVQGNFDKS